MSTIQKLHWYSAAAVDNTVCESECDRKNGAWNKKRSNSKVFNRIIIIGLCLYWDGSVPSVNLCDTGFSSAQRSQINRIYISWSDTAEPSFPPHPSIHMHPTHRISHQCYSSIYLLEQPDQLPHISGFSPPLWDIIWKMNSFSSFLESDLQCALCAWWHSHVHCSNLMIHAQYNYNDSAL